MDLSGRVALVTGGAGGIGSATMRAFARAGAAAVVGYRSGKEQAEQVAGELRELGVRAEVAFMDVRDDGSVRRAVAEIERQFGHLDVLVNNAGVTKWIPIRELDGVTDDIWDEILDVNLVGAFRCTRAAAPLLRKARGAVVNVSSISGVLASSTLSSIPYGAAKAALIHLTRSLAVALSPDVRVNAVAPALVDTRWIRDHYADGFDAVADQARTAFPLGRIGTPDEVAAAIVALVSGGDFVTGQTLLVDGGRSII